MAQDRSRTPLIAALQRFLNTEASSGILLLLGAIVGLLWANLEPGSYERLWDNALRAGAGSWSITLDLRHWINEAAMALFFLVVGLEIKRELVGGELRDPRAAAFPVAAALGGMIVPALIYLAVSAGDHTNGWGIPVATDIAFALGVLALVGRRLPSGLKLFLLTLAIVDDIGAIILIAVFYTASVSLVPLAVAAGLMIGAAFLHRAGIRWVPLHLAIAIAVWIAVHESGIHATIAGVAVAMLTPVGVAERIEAVLHPWTSFVIVPLFALANAGVRLGAVSLGESGSLKVAAGVAAGLVVGKFVGIVAGAAIASRAGLARLPDGARGAHIGGVAALGGIGFTVSLFVAGLAFPEGATLDAAKIGILVGSTVSGATGAMMLVRASGRVQGEGVAAG